jgi:hypothetical protein
MGGYFGAYVLANLAFLGLAAWRRTREARAAAMLFGGVTLVVSLMPQSHELRYYMHWMMLLVSLNLILWTSPRFGHARGPLALGLTATLALAVVAWSTNADFLYASGSTFAEYLAKRAPSAAFSEVVPGDHLCVSRQPFTFLYAPAFHPTKTYAVQEAVTDEDCRGARPLR